VLGLGVVKPRRTRTLSDKLMKRVPADEERPRVVVELAETNANRFAGIIFAAVDAPPVPMTNHGYEYREVVDFLGVSCLKETEKALLCAFANGHHFWFPKSHVDQHSQVKAEGDSGCLVVSRWIAERKGLA
jgi:hypothetical protein